MPPVTPPIHLSTTYLRNPDGTYENGYVYSRAGNPNRQALEEQLAELEGGAYALAFSSGMAAIQSLFLALKTGDHLLLPDDVYFNVRLLLDEVMADWGLTYTAVDMTDLQAIEDALQQNTRLVWLETPSNPQLKVTDIAAVCSLVDDRDIRVAVDNTWPTPIHQLPFALGADYVVHSTTKYMGGHSDVLGGALIAKQEDDWAAKLRRIQHVGGAVPSPMDCYLVSRGLQTLRLRVQAQTTSAHQLATFLEGHDEIEAVLYPGLPSHPQHDVAKKQMREGFGAMLSVLVRGDAKRAMSVAAKLQHFAVATSLGGVESLVEHRKSVEGPASATPNNLLRLSVGVEPVATLIEDWEQALATN
ncbi:PLP-dependent aspartate aminotransferase family protein [Lewinella sp. 4G2]|uniref:trans-sulfuration enzyme family protein n=1 Tax=Lewinella sp. 4G2 TaxID=1803372 RepID=UPI0007B4C970|nr:aminotransferase class I/II-fold pyridoxal phosphate-dependent enzyme [Lewinella sp. 4G2]OAV44363.1 cystathionine gamma-synthase [Lewinella sp. 4G2]